MHSLSWPSFFNELLFLYRLIVVYSTVNRWISSTVLILYSQHPPHSLSFHQLIHTQHIESDNGILCLTSSLLHCLYLQCILLFQPYLLVKPACSMYSIRKMHTLHRLIKQTHPVATHISLTSTPDQSFTCNEFVVWLKEAKPFHKGLPYK